MSQASGQGTPQPTGDGARAEDDVLLVECNRVSQLPGMWAKRVTVGADQIGFVMSKGSVVRELGSGTAKVGMSILGLTGRNREVLRFRVRPFRLLLKFGHVHTDIQGHVLPAIELTATIVTPSLLYSTELNGQGRLYTSQLSAIIAGAVEGLACEKLTGAADSGRENDDRGGLMEKLDMPIRKAMAERGLEVSRIEAVSRERDS